MSDQRHDTRSAPIDELDADLEPLEPIDLRALLQLHPRLLLAAAILAVLMVPVGLLLAWLGVKVLDFSGGAARDTSAVVGVAGYLVSDFWGGGAVAALTRARAPQVAIAWGLARVVVTVIAVIAVPTIAPAAPFLVALAIPAAFGGARVARKQAALRRQIELEKAAAASEVTAGLDASTDARERVDALT